MKLYTEEEIRRTFGFEMHEIEFKSFMNAIKPIDLPTDDEIIEVYDNGIDRDTDWIVGAIWMRDKIQGGNK